MSQDVAEVKKTSSSTKAKPAPKPPAAKRRENPLKGALIRNAEAHREGNVGAETNLIADTKLAKSIPVELIDPSPWQPRKNFNDKKLQELAELIDAQGLLQPIEVRSVNNRYQLVSGERRLRAHKLLQQRYIQAFVIVITDEEASSRALVENLGRENLSDFEVYLSIKRHHKDFGEQYGYEHWGMAKSSYFRMLSFDFFPPAVNDLLSDYPDLVSAYSAEEAKRLINSEVEKGVDKSRYDAALKSLVQQAIDGRKKLSNLAAQLFTFLNPNRALPNKKELSFQGSKAGEITKKANHTQLKLNHSAFNDEKLARLESFISELLSE